MTVWDGLGPFGGEMAVSEGYPEFDRFDRFRPFGGKWPN
jgi:hypothetical protein